MTHKTHNQSNFAVVMIAFLMIAVIALSTGTAFAGSISRPAPVPVPPSEEHPPVCLKVDTYAPGIVALECTDMGEDILDVGVKTNTKYDLSWDAKSVSLRVYAGEKGDTAFWYVRDKNGSVSSGTLP